MIPLTEVYYTEQPPRRVHMTPKKRILMRSSYNMAAPEKPSMMMLQRQQSDPNAVLTAARALLSLSPHCPETLTSQRRRHHHHDHESAFAPPLATPSSSSFSSSPTTALKMPLLLHEKPTLISSADSEVSDMSDHEDNHHHHPSTLHQQQEDDARDAVDEPQAQQQEQPRGPFYTGSTTLALDQDDESLSPLHCFMRQFCVEAFTASEDDATTHKFNGRRIVPGQVGIRCLHCKHRSQRQERAICFPSSLKNIYHSIETWQRRHSLVCQDIPPWIKVNMAKLMRKSRSGGGGRRQYWEESAKRIGIVDTENGLRFILPPGEMMMREDNDTQATPQSSASLLSSARSSNASCSDSMDNNNNAPVSQPVVSQEDKQLVTGYLFVLMEQMEACQFTEQDRTGGRSKVKNCPAGYPGLQCKHCGGKAGFGRYFPASLQALTSANSDRNIYNHINKCRRCPDHIRQELQRLNEEQNQRNYKNRRGSRKLFFCRVWQRLHGAAPPPQQAAVPEQSLSSQGNHHHGNNNNDDQCMRL